MIIASKHFPRIITGAVLVSVLGTALYLSGPYLFGLLLLFYARRPVGILRHVLAAQGQHRRAYPRPCARRPAHHRRMDAPRNGRHGPRPVHADPRLHVPVLLVARRQVPLYAGRGARRGAAVRSHADHARPEFLHSRATAAHLYGGRFGHGCLFLRYALRQAQNLAQSQPQEERRRQCRRLAASVAVAVCFGLAFGVPTTGISDYALLGLVLGVMAQLGDFFESALKRSRSVKDSGNVLPGHGGVLDRVDSLLFVIPTYECARALVTFF